MPLLRNLSASSSVLGRQRSVCVQPDTVAKCNALLCETSSGILRSRSPGSIADRLVTLPSSV
jgi:hypothetical protein